jgi:AGCS family alanine or glycine:cation symporter
VDQQPEFLARLAEVLGWVNDLVWGWPTMVLLAGVGVWLTIRLRGLQFRQLPKALGMVLGRGAEKPTGEEGDISNFQALMTALSATVGTGNIAGVASAIAVGGPGAMFWMWMMGLVGMATKYAEAVLAVHYRVRDGFGTMSGGPMYYLERGLRWRVAGLFFAFFTAVSSLAGIGNMVQSNSIADALSATFSVPTWITAIVLMIATGLVLVGGIQGIGRVAGVVVPTMIIGYVVAALFILVTYADAVPAAFALIFEEAFTDSAATGGFVGASVTMGIRMGVSRGLFSNESGLGSAPIAAAAAKTRHPVQQALFSMTQTFIDTIMVCTLTGLVLIVTGAWSNGMSGAPLTSTAFGMGLTGGSQIVTIGLLFFAWTTMLGWSYYGEKSTEYLIGEKAVKAYRVLFVLLVGVGAVIEADLVWTIGDICNALMALPNLLGILGLTPVIVMLTYNYFVEGGDNWTSFKG